MKRLVYSICFLPLAAMLLGAFTLSAAAQESQPLLQLDASDEQIVTVQNGSTGAFFTITDAQEIQQILDSLNGFQYTSAVDWPVAGWQYRILLRDGDESLDLTVQKNAIVMGATRYVNEETEPLSELTALLDEIFTRHPDFSDVSAGTWYHEAVDFVLRNGLMSGYGDGLFGPNDALTRAELAQILYNKEGKPAVTGGSGFTDVVGGAWYTPAVTWAAANGIVVGCDNGKFGPNDNITREQLAVMLWRYAKFKGYDTAQGGMVIREFSDYESIPGYAMDAMTWAVNTGVIGGYEDQTLRPQADATRAQAAQMFKNFLENN